MGKRKATPHPNKKRKAGELEEEEEEIEEETPGTEDKSPSEKHKTPSPFRPGKKDKTPPAKEKTAPPKEKTAPPKEKTAPPKAASVKGDKTPPGKRAGELEEGEIATGTSSSDGTPSAKRVKPTLVFVSFHRKHEEVEEEEESSEEELEETEYADDLSAAESQKQEEEFQKISNSLKYKYSIDKMLGEGSFGRVFAGTDIITGQAVALKFVNKHFLTLSDRPDALEDELKVMLKLRHPCVIKLQDILNYWQGWMVIVMELCLGGTLIYDVVEKTKSGLSEKRAKLIFKQIAEAVSYLHKNNICHRDLNGANILMKYQGKDEIRIVDFGSARIMKSKQDMLTTFSGAEVIRAPEITKANAPYDATKCDSWSMGCILYKMLTNHWPYASIVAAQNSGKKGPNFPAKISPEARALLANLLHVNPAKRWSAEQSLGCDWLKTDLPPALLPENVEKTKANMETRAQRMATAAGRGNMPANARLSPSASCIIS